MKLVNFLKNNDYALGIKVNEGIIDVELALNHQFKSKVPQNIKEVIFEGNQGVEKLQDYINTLDISYNSPYILDENNIEWGPCVENPSKIICVGLNYQKHAEETNASFPESPILFNKFNNSLTGNNSDIIIPKVTNQLDYEVELGIVIGETIKNVSKEKALENVFGYFVANDLSARDLQFKTNQWLLGKTCDGFCPIGPYLVTKDEIENPNKLTLKTTVNGTIRQNSNTSDMIFNCDEIVSYISQYMTLKPGDIILTGTPEGVVLGLPEKDRVYINPGDEITVEIEKLGKLTNKFIAE